ncbi:MAG TPA: PilZ domain-containing protein [Polyangia bacterium]|jgi:hypothetical protein|nr:PilZ domain-containing protein [Polyangia bacterium]
MKPVDSFFFGLRGAFRPDDNVGAALLAALALLLIAALWWLVRRRRRRVRSVVDHLRRFIAHQNLTLDDVETLDALATIAGERPMEVGTRLESFERSSAIALQGHPPTMVVRDGDFFARLRRLRDRLGFADLPNHFPLLTTRELAVGATVDLEGASAAVTDVNEAFWAVDSPSNLPVGAGAELEAAVVRANDARYVFKCRLLATQPLLRGHILMLSHDEAPVRAQLREFVRINVSGTLRFRPPAPAGKQTAPVAPAFADVDGALVDVSLGGLAGHIATPLAAGTAGLASFAFADERYEGIDAVVLDCRPQATGSYLLRLTFRKLRAADEQRLAAAITAHTARPL